MVVDLCVCPYHPLMLATNVLALSSVFFSLCSVQYHRAGFDSCILSITIFFFFYQLLYLVKSVSQTITVSIVVVVFAFSDTLNNNQSINQQQEKRSCFQDDQIICRYAYYYYHRFLPFQFAVSFFSVSHSAFSSVSCQLRPVLLCFLDICCTHVSTWLFMIIPIGNYNISITAHSILYLCAFTIIFLLSSSLCQYYYYYYDQRHCSAIRSNFLITLFFVPLLASSLFHVSALCVSI